MDVERPTALRPSDVGASPWLLPAFVAAVFTSALLLFAVQPMFTRMVLPRLGGSPSVWSVAMVFFQTMLLAGYAYAHFLTQNASARLTVGLHLALLVVAALTLPLAIAQGWGVPPGDGATFWLLGLFAVSIGLPFFALSANNPLLQAWFVKTGHRDAGNPYFLYAASNIGSFLALLAYPAVLEPTLPLRAHNTLWTFGFYGLIGLIAWCGYFVLRTPAQALVANENVAAPAIAPTWRDIGRWVFLAGVPSGLLVAVTAHLSTDVAAAPLLWVLPLSLYLITWVIVFQTKPSISHRWILRLEPLGVVALVAVAALAADQNLLLTLSVHLVAFFLITMACHGELARRRPHPRYLTGFYLSLSAGGMIGGVFAGLIAPRIFSWIAEYPILIVLAILCRPLDRGGWGRGGWGRGERIFWIVAILVAGGLALPRLAFGWTPDDALSSTISWSIVALAAASLALIRDARKFAFAIAVALALVQLYPFEAGRFETLRSFFGVHKIRETADGNYRVLMHGTTIHGAQQLRDAEGRPVEGRPEPLTYYHAESPMADAIAAIRRRKGGPIRVAAVGLGTGSLACHVEPGEAWRFFEIDPDVIAIARDPKRFTFLQGCAPEIPIVLGDARLTLANDDGGPYDLVIIDAFSSDSIPVHLLTREAMAVYKTKLAPDGAVVMHVSNLHLELASVAVGIAAENGLKAWVNYDPDNEDREDEYKFSSSVAIAAAKAGDIGDLGSSENWELTEPEAGQRTWTDDYSNIIGAIWRQLF